MTTDARRRDEVVQEGDQSIVGQALKYSEILKYLPFNGVSPRIVTSELDESQTALQYPPDGTASTHSVSGSGLPCHGSRQSGPADLCRCPGSQALPGNVGGSLPKDWVAHPRLRAYG